MTEEERTAKYRKYAEPGGPLHGLFAVRKVDVANFKVEGLFPHEYHPFCVGPEHVVYASKHNSGRLDEEVCRRFPCAHEFHQGYGRRRCGLVYDRHTHDTILFLSLVRDLGQAEAGAALKAIADELTKDKIDGVAFVETPQKYRIAPREKKEDDREGQAPPDTAGGAPRPPVG